MKYTFLMALLLAAWPQLSEAKDPELNLGRITWSAFECHMFASIAENEQESARLFMIGYETGQLFLKKVFNGKLTTDYLHSNVPMGITMLLRDGGPSEEFILGRIYETVSNSAYDKAVKDDENGAELPLDQWRMDIGVKKIYAENLYHNGNCELIQ